VLGLAGGEGLQEHGAAVLETIENGAVELGRVGHGDLGDEGRTVAGEEGFGDGLLLSVLALGGGAEGVHVAAAEHGGGVGVLAAGVGVDLGIEHEGLDVGAVLQDDLGHVLVADVAHAAVAADDPDLGQLDDFLVGHQGVGEVGVVVVLLLVDDVLIAGEEDVGEALGEDGAAGVVDDEAFAHEPADGDAVLEERVHPRVGVGVVGRGGTVDGVAAGVGGHGHDGHSIGQAAVDGLQALVVEGLSEQDGGDGLRRAAASVMGPLLGFVGGDAGLGVFHVFAAEAEDEVGDGLAEQGVLAGVALGEGGKRATPFFSSSPAFGDEAVALGVIDGAHVGLGDSGDGAEDGLFTAAGAGAVAGDEGVVVGADHEHVAQGGGLGVGRVGGVEEAEILLRGVGQQIEEGGAGFVLGVDLFGFLHHAERVVVAAGGDAGGAAFAEIADEDGEDAAGAGGLALGRGEDGVDLLIGHGHLGDDVEELLLRLLREAFGISGGDGVGDSRRMVGMGVPVFISATMRWRAAFRLRAARA
jgi:hypothetical protein